MQKRKMIKGSVEWLEVKVTADTVLTNQPVAISLDRGDWITAEWAYSPGAERIARALIDTSPLEVGDHAVCIRITDNPEAPVLSAGTLQII